ncbi:MAG: hypothetical protein ACO3L1_06375, partial [Flavobacteriaceae bacterium]
MNGNISNIKGANPLLPPIFEKGFVVESDKPETLKHPKPKGEYAVRSLNQQCGISSAVEHLVYTEAAGS